ncbi:MAG: DUF6159 family protein [Acidimicrobiia bacterium]
MERIGNAWRIGKASWSVLAKDRELAVIPVVAGLAALLAFGLIAGPGIVLLGGLEAAETQKPALWLLGFFAMVAATWVSAVGQAAVISGAAERMTGGQPDLRSAVAGAWTRAGRLFGWAVMATVVSLVLDQFEQRFGLLGRFVSWAGRVAFGVLSFLALPVIVFEDLGAIDAFKRSAAMVRRTWGEQVTFNFGMGLLGFVACLPSLVVGMAALGSGSTVVLLVGVAAAGAWLMVVAAVTSALSAIFKTALYRWANGLAVDPAFDADVLSGAFRPKG